MASAHNLDGGFETLGIEVAGEGRYSTLRHSGESQLPRLGWRTATQTNSGLQQLALQTRSSISNAGILMV
jgi:hypothetical protein